MKKNIVLSLLLMLLLCFTGLVSCKTPDPLPQSTPIPVISDGDSDYIIVFPKDNTTWRKYAIELSNKLNVTGVRIQVTDDSAEQVAKEILVGPTNRALSTALVTEIDRADDEDYAWGVRTDEQSIALYSSGAYAWERCLAYLTEAAYVSADGVTFPSYTWDLQLLTWEEREAELNAGKEDENEEEAKKEREERYETILAGIEDFDIDDFGGAIITTDLGGRWKAPTETPIDEHPRLLFTSDDLPNLRKTFTDTKNYPELVAAFEKLYNSTSDGKLGERYERTDHAPGNYNYEPKELIIIQAKALQYLLTGDEFYGYDAIYSLLNNIQTLDIGYFKDDQWRRYGHTMYTAALVYDWCYDLLDADLKMLIISGVEHLLCTGTSAMPDKAHHGGVKMEMGFPPVKEGGTIVGHSSETQFMRDYLSFAIAIFDEVPGWWEMIAGRLYEEYVPPREYIYSAGMFPEGTAGYAQMRFMTDLRAIWLLEKAVGESPYNGEDVAQIVRSFIGHEVVDGYILSTGDGGVPSSVSTFVGCGFMHAYLFGDDVVMSMIRETYGETFNYVTYDHTQLSPIEVLICLSETDTSSLTENWRDEVDLIQYNDSYYQQIIVMNKRNDEDTIAVLLKGAGHSSGGHDHESIGKFQIYYKGALTADAGVYDTYGTDHHYYYHEATIGHNSLLIYNPTYKYTQSGFYSGGQEKLNKTATGPAWVTDTWYDTGVVTGVSYGYLDEEKTSPKYVYYANDMSKAYNSATASYVGRTMLVTYTEDETFPMVMFVFDNITAKKDTYQKTFLLHCVKQPTISGNTVTVDNGKGKLVLTSLKGGDSIKSYGGDQQFYINGANKIVNSTNGATGPMWGRVEICPNTGKATDYLMNVMYVTDSGTTEKVTPTLIESDTLIGAVALNQTAIFMKSTDYVDETVSFIATGAGKDMNYYIGGIAEGTWTVKVGTKTVGTFDVSDTEHFLTFTTNATGNVTLTYAG